jgi:hypothetical protein
LGVIERLRMWPSRFATRSGGNFALCVPPFGAVSERDPIDQRRSPTLIPR